MVGSGARTPHIHRTNVRALDIKLGHRRRRPRHFMELVAVEITISKLVFGAGEPEFREWGI